MVQNTPVTELTDQQIQGRLRDFGNYGYAYEGDDQAHRDLEAERKRRELPALCPSCECPETDHRDAVYMTPAGDEIDGMACPPEGCREGDALEHWSMFGCDDIDAAFDRDVKAFYCASCGNDVPEAAAKDFIRKALRDSQKAAR